MVNPMHTLYIMIAFIAAPLSIVIASVVDQVRVEACYITEMQDMAWRNRTDDVQAKIVKYCEVKLSVKREA